MLSYILGITKWGSKGITNRIRFYGLQIGERGITNEGSLRDFKSEKKFTNWGRDLILGQRDFKSKLKLQIMSRECTCRERNYKSVQNMASLICLLTHSMLLVLCLSIPPDKRKPLVFRGYRKRVTWNGIIKVSSWKGILLPFNCQPQKMVKYTHFCGRNVWVCLTILWIFHLKGLMQHLILNEREKWELKYFKRLNHDIFFNPQEFWRGYSVRELRCLCCRR